MPQPIFVAIVCSRYAELNRLRRKLKVSEPGVAPKYCLIALDVSGKRVITPKDIPQARIDLWITLDDASFEIAKKQHQKDRANKKYDRGFYEHLFPETIIKTDVDLSDPKSIKLIEDKLDLIRKVFCETS